MRFAVVLAVVVVTRAAHADPASELARARALEAQLEYDQALAIVDQLLARGGSDPLRYVELQLLAGKLAAGLDRPQLAETHYARALAVRPELALPDGTSPKLTDPFDRVRAQRPVLRITAKREPGAIVLAVQDSLGLVAGVSLRIAGQPERSERAALRIAILPEATVVEVAALDATGNRIWVGAAPAAPRVVHVSTPIYTRWSTYAIAGGAALAFGGFAAWRFDRAQAEWNALRAGGGEFTELEAIEDRGRRWAIAANIGFGVGAAASVATLIFALRGGSSTLTIVPTADGAGISGRF
ncbi:MAG: hypothetical protein ABI867_21800 [Kofleriaceae bacterium]